MKRFAFYITCCSLVALFSCTHDDIDEVFTPVGDGKITIQSTLDDMAITRATVDDTNPERTITHIDVFAIDESGNIDYYERNTTGNNNGAAEDGAGRLTLSVSRRAKDANDNYIFEQGANYKFILVANAVAEDDDMAELATLSDLERLVQDDSFETSFAGGGNGTEGDTTEGDGTDNGTGGATEGTTGGATGGTPTMSRQTLLHLSGTKLGENPDNKETPQTFLMDAVATANGNDKHVVNPVSNTTENLNLSAEFKRAASKIIVNITQGKDVEFRTQLDSQSAQYDFYKLPASTFVLPNESKLVNIQLINTAPMQPNTETFIWEYTDASNSNPCNENTIQVIGYAYSHSWSDVDLTNETSLILNIPMMWNKDNKSETGYSDGDDKPNVGGNGKEEKAPKSWYKVPLSQGKKFERNKCYIVNIVINAVGASTRSTAIELRDIEYKTLDWQDVDITVGDSSENPEYLTLNTNLVNIYNMNFDYTQLEFSSSSYIPNNFANENSSASEKNNIKNNGGIILTDAYYYNYLDQKVELSTTAGDKYKIYADIKSTAEQDVLNGKINIESPFVGISEQELYEQFGAAPVVPAMPTEPVNPVPAEAENPGTQSEYAKAMSQTPPTNPTNNATYYEYRWNNNRFERKTWTYTENWWGGGSWDDDDWSSNWQGRQQMLANYNNALAAWNTWNKWNSLSQDEKDVAIAKYEEDVATYPERLAYYNQQVAAKEKYDADVAKYTAGKVDSHSNAIRYLVFEVYNQTGQKATFTVVQYPILYITNEMGWYSYRSDFGGTTYEKKGNPNYSGVNWSNGKWDYGREGSNSYFFGSKVAFPDDDSYSIEYYNYENKGTKVNTEGTISASLNNPRMYHVHVTATSSKYTVGKPRLDANGFTESSLENSRLVSPSFMIASQLGATQSPDGGVNQAKQHCEQYVEVTKNAVYDDWRLPTAAEIEIIASHQDASDAMATVMTGWAYYCSYNVIDGEVVYYQKTGKTDNRDTAVRCIRDAY